jgi:hypothetical protein
MKKIIFLTLMLSAFLMSFCQTKRPVTKRTTKPAPKTAAKTTTVKKTTAKVPAKTTTTSSAGTSTTSANNNFTNTEKTNTTTTTSTTSTASQKNKAAKTRSKSSSDGLCFIKGSKVIDLGIGFSGYGTPIHGAFEHFFTDDISAGVFLNFASYSGFSVIWGGVKGNYHFNRILNLNDDKVDLSAGASIGYWSVGGTGFSTFGNTVFFGVQIGGRYFFSDKIGAFAEFGGGNLSGGIVGVSFKF